MPKKKQTVEETATAVEEDEVDFIKEVQLLMGCSHPKLEFNPKRDEGEDQSFYRCEVCKALPVEEVWDVSTEELIDSQFEHTAKGGPDCSTQFGALQAAKRLIEDPDMYVMAGYNHASLFRDLKRVASFGYSDNTERASAEAICKLIIRVLGLPPFENLPSLGKGSQSVSEAASEEFWLAQ